MIAIDGISGGAQIKGIFITVILATLSGLVVGKILALLGRRQEPYIDSEEFMID